MTQEEKQLVLKDLCARLPYVVKVCARFNTGNSYTTNVTAICEDRDYIQLRQNVLHPYTGSSIEDIRPYLRPMSSMTDDERKEWYRESHVDYDCEFHPTPTLVLEHCHLSTDWLLKHHFDFRGLIEKGLALEAPEGMYN